MVTIRITDHVQQASTYDDGNKIFNLISKSFEQDEPIVVSFAGIQAVPSAFVNAAFLQLLEHTTLENIQKKLVFADSTKFINDLIRRRFQFVADNPA